MLVGIRSLAFSGLRTSPLKSFLRNYRVAIVGTGPGGFYTGHHLLHKAHGVPLEIDFFERLPTPYGLSRYGVAPDHPEVKNCEECLDDLMKNFGDKIRFIGNVNIGKDISLKTLQECYHLVVLAYGCTSSDNRLNIPGSDLPGIISAREFVNWYNNHPDSITNGFVPPPLHKIKDVSIIGNGNVAIDVARILLANAEQHWGRTDINPEAYKLLSSSEVKRVNIVGRRGILESAFTTKEIRELIDIEKHLAVWFNPIDEEILEPERGNISKLPRPAQRKIKLLDSASKNHESEKPNPDSKEWKLEYYKSPKAFQAHESDPELLKSTIFDKTQLQIDPVTQQKTAKSTGNTEEVMNELVILAIGYKGAALPGFDDVGLAFDKRRNSLLHEGGRLVLNSSAQSDAGAKDLSQSQKSLVPGWYTSGWIKTGPKGVIAQTMLDAFNTGSAVLEDLRNNVHTGATLHRSIDDHLPKDVVTWKDWELLNNQELAEGKSEGKTRRKFSSTAEMLSFLKLKED